MLAIILRAKNTLKKKNWIASCLCSSRALFFSLLYVYIHVLFSLRVSLICLISLLILHITQPGFCTQSPRGNIWLSDLHKQVLGSAYKKGVLQR